MSDEQQFDIKKHPLATGNEGKLLLSFAIPSIISMLVGSLYNIADQIFIGHKVGILGNAATNVAFPLMTICMALSLLCGIGGGSNFNLELGRGNREHAGQFIANAITCVFAGGVIFSAVTLLFLEPILLAFGATPQVLSYAIEYTGIIALGMPFMMVSVCGSHLIRADGSPRYSMCCNLAGALLNVALDPLFIFTFDMGVAGAAWATVISILVSWLMVVRYLVRFKNVPLKKEYFIPHLREVKSLAAFGMGVSTNQIAVMCVQVTLNNTLTHYGALSAYGANIPLAASGIITKVNQIFMSIVIGLAQGGQPIIGFNYGAGNYARARRTLILALSIASVLSLIAFTIFQVFPRQIIDFFGETNEQYYHFVERYFRIFLFMAFVNGVQPVGALFFSAIGRAHRSLFIGLTRQILILIPLLLIFPTFWGIDGVIYAGPISDSVAAVIAGLFITQEIRDMKRMEKAAWNGDA